MEQLYQKKVNIGIRFASMLIDHCIMSFLGGIFYVPVFIKAFSTAIKSKGEQVTGDPFSGPLMWVALAGFSLYFCKDCIGGRSLAKRMLSLQVIDVSSGKAASPLKCLVRNLFCVLWPVEVIITIINPERRLGDRVAGTKTIVFVSANTASSKINIPQVILAFIIAYGLMLTIMYWMNAL